MPPRIPTLSTASSSPLRSQARAFSTTPSAPARLGRKLPSEEGWRYGFYRFLNQGVGKDFKTHTTPGTPHYLGDWNANTGERITPENEPFVHNKHFKVHPVLAVDFRNEVWRRVAKDGKGVREVSSEMGVELERVAACVRLGEIEKEWVKKRKPLATVLTTAIHSMHPVSRLAIAQGREHTPHESNTEIVIHPATHTQLFLPTPESAVFNRQSAADALGLLPSHIRVPNAHLIEIEAEKAAGISLNDRIAREQERISLAERRKEAKAERERKREEGEQVVTSDRWRFRLRPAKTGVVGHRYGFPHEDRKRGQIKIPTRAI